MSRDNSKYYWYDYLLFPMGLLLIPIGLVLVLIIWIDRKGRTKKNRNEKIFK